MWGGGVKEGIPMTLMLVSFKSEVDIEAFPDFSASLMVSLFLIGSIQTTDTLLWMRYYRGVKPASTVTQEEDVWHGSEIQTWKILWNLWSTNLSRTVRT